MTNRELAKNVLNNIQDESFRLDVSASTGGRCCDGWGDSLDLDLSRPQLLYLVHQRNRNDYLFEGLTLEEVDVDAIINDMTKEAAWPDGGPAATVNDVIPNELSKLSEELESLYDSDKETVNEIRKKLHEVSDGQYTFYFTVEASGYYFTEDAEESVELTAEEALGLLRGKYDMPEVFDGICNIKYDEYLVNRKADELGFADDYDYFSYGGECEQLEAYLNAWDYIIDSILDDEIPEDLLDSWLEYFDDTDNYEYEIVEWYEEREEYEND